MKYRCKIQLIGTINPTLFRRYFKKNLLHRDNGPAIKSPEVECWYKNGVFIPTEKPKINIFKNEKGHIYYYDDKRLYHREDGPAVIEGGRKFWYRHGVLHRKNGPAIIVKTKNGTDEYWYLNNKLHRDFGAAIILHNGREEWWHQGERHRLSGPAVIENGNYEWWLCNQLHREDGPAVIQQLSQKRKEEYYLFGKKFTKEKFLLSISKENFLSFIKNEKQN